MFELSFNVLILSAFFVVTGYTILNIREIIKYLKRPDNKYMDGILYGIYAAVSVVLIYNPLDSERNKVVDFKRVIGAGIVANVDVSRKTGSFMLWFLGLAIAFAVVFLAVSYFFSLPKSEEDMKVIKFLNNAIIVANINLVLRCISYFNDKINEQGVFDYTSCLLIVIISASFAYLILHLHTKISTNNYIKLICIGFSLAYPVITILQLNWTGGRTLLVIQIVLIAVCIVSAKIGGKFWMGRKVEIVLSGFAVAAGLFPFTTSFYIELIHILNQHAIFVTSLREYYVVITVFQLVTGLAFGLWCSKRQYNLLKWKQWIYLFLVIGITCMSVQLPLAAPYDAKIFETANSSIPISDFLNFGSIPLVEHYSGHMMSKVWEGLIYALLNNDMEGAIFSPYANYVNVVYIVLFYCLVRWVWNEDMAFLTVLMIPFRNNWYYFAWGMLVCAAIIAYVKKNSYLRAFVLWFSCVWCALYRLDIGAAFGVACIAVLAVYIIVFRNGNALKQLVFSLSGWGIGGIFLWFVLCMAKGINPVNRLRKFLEISLSNANWAYETIGYAGNTFFSWCYIFMPFSILVGLIITVFSKQLREKAGMERWIILLVMGFSYFANFSRGLVRHSLVESSWASVAIIWTGYIFISVFISCDRNNKKIFLPVFMALTLLNNLFVMDDNFNLQPVLNAAAAETGTFVETWTKKDCYLDNSEKAVTCWEGYKENGVRVGRVQWKEPLADTIYPYKELLDGLLDPEETFVDFINKTFIYSAVNRKCPVYVSQSPMQLSGEFTQEMFIDEIQGVPLVLMPAGDNSYNSDAMDGITNAYRYYKVSEYIYQNYVPLCKFKDIFAVWCLKERYGEFDNRLRNRPGLVYERIEYGYDGPCRKENGSFEYLSVLHNHDINQLTGIWAECDSKNAVHNEVTDNLGKEDDYFVFDSINPSEKGNYLKMDISCSGEALKEGNNNAVLIPAIVKVGVYGEGTFEEKYQYRFMLNEGEGNYLIRISTDYYWYSHNINAVSIETDAVLSEVSMCILEGD